MSEFYFIINNERLKEDIKKENIFKNKIVEAIFKIKEEFGLNDFNFAYSKERISIGNLNYEDSKKIEGQRFKNGKFRPNSTINKRYLELVKDVENCKLINIWMYYNLEVYGHFETKKFIHDEKIYFYIKCSQNDIKIPEDFTKIKASEFHLAEEDLKK